MFTGKILPLLLAVMLTAVLCCGCSAVEAGEYMVQVWQEDELAASGFAVGDGSQVLTVINYELANPNSVDLEVTVNGQDRYTATVQAIDSRTGASLLKIEGGKLPIAATSSALDLTAERQLFIRQWRIPPGGNEDEPEISESDVLASIEEYDLSTSFSVRFYSGEAGILPDITSIGQGAVVTDENGSVLGLAGVDYDDLFPHPHPIGYIPGIVSIDSALELLAPDASQQYRANGPLHFVYAKHSGETLYTRGLNGYEAAADGILEILNNPGAPLSDEDLLHDYYQFMNSREDHGGGNMLTVIYAQPVAVLNADGETLAYAKWVSIHWGRDGSKPNRLLYGSDEMVVEGGFLIDEDISGFLTAISPIVSLY